VRVGGATYVVFPPFPAIVAAPLVALRGASTTGFAWLGVAAWGIGAWSWSRIADGEGLDAEARRWLVAAMAFASPLFFVTLRADRVWFFAQGIAFACASLAFLAARARRHLLAGIAIGAALLSRQLSIFHAPILIAIAALPDATAARIDRAKIAAAATLFVPVAISVALLLAYDRWRFGSAFDTGYAHLEIPDGPLKARVDAHGLWSAHYVPTNALYLIFQGFHAELSGPSMARVSGIDALGTGIVTASPWLVLMFFAPLRRSTVACGVLIVAMTTLMLFFHANGYTQANTQRFTLDWLPAALWILVCTLRREHLPIFKLLVAWGIVLNVATVAILALTRHAPG
jgi:hypothetical protein